MGVGGAFAASLGVTFWDDLLAATPTRRGHYGALAPPDANGLRLPPGFTARLIARGGERVRGTSYRWHDDSDGAAVFGAAEGGFVLVSNSEADPGGASAIRFDGHGRVTDAYRILADTRRNCSGGATPWGTWLSCEEIDDGMVWECDPSGRRRAIARPALGVFLHEAAAIDPADGHVYLTEDLDGGRLYRFTPKRWCDLSDGVLEAAVVHDDRSVTWTRVRDPRARRKPTREQVSDAAGFGRAEGIWFDGGIVYIATTEDSRIHAYDTRVRRLRVIYDAKREPDPVLTRVDSLTASPGGELFVCEDRGRTPLDIGIVTRFGEASRFLSAVGARHRGSELTGVVFDPSGTRMFFASQRASRRGEIYEVSGPFSGRAAGDGAPHTRS